MIECQKLKFEYGDNVMIINQNMSNNMKHKKIHRDFEIRTGDPIEARKLDLLLINMKKRSYHVEDFAVAELHMDFWHKFSVDIVNSLCTCVLRGIQDSGNFMGIAWANHVNSAIRNNVWASENYIMTEIFRLRLSVS